MKLREWFALRGPRYIYKRAAVLLDRYDITTAKAAGRIEACLPALADFGCAPTFPTPGYVVQRYPQFLHHLQDVGAEIAVHGYDHTDLGVYPPTQASTQLMRTAQVFARHGIEVHGFRCPYLSCSDDLLNALPEGVFGYSSNAAIWWDVVSPIDADNQTKGFETLQRLYKPRLAYDTVCTPWMRSNLVEIPVSLPDDLQLHDGLHLDPEGMAQAWSQILHRTHRRGELFVLEFHPELARYSLQAIVMVLREATCLQPPVWITRLRDINNWWREKSSFAVALSHTPTGLRISFNCSERATILVKGLGSCGSDNAQCPEPFGFAQDRPVEGWDGAYYQLKAKTLQVASEPRPFVGLPADAPRSTSSFLLEQGYILDTGETATRCAAYIDAATLAGLTSQVELIKTIEASPGPLVRYWRWPDGAKSALCITGDVDALSLLDYASRMFVR